MPIEATQVDIEEEVEEHPLGKEEHDDEDDKVEQEDPEQDHPRFYHVVKLSTATRALLDRFARES